MPSEENKDGNGVGLSTDIVIDKLFQNCSNSENVKLKTASVDNITKEDEVDNKNFIEQISEESNNEEQITEKDIKEQQIAEDNTKEQQITKENVKEQQITEIKTNEQEITEDTTEQHITEENTKEQQITEIDTKQQQIIQEDTKEHQITEENIKEQQITEIASDEQQITEEIKQQKITEEEIKQKITEEEIKPPQITEEIKQQQTTEENTKEQQIIEEGTKEEEKHIFEKKADKQEKSQDTSKIKPFRIEDEPTRLTDEDGWLDILGSGDLKKKVIKAGEGLNSRAQRGQWVSMRCVGKLENGKIVEEDNNLSIIVGDSDIVQGLDLSIALMEKGEIAEIIVPSRLAYGKLGNSPHIPPDSVIHYEVEILDVKETDDEANLPLGERQRIGNEKRERGNFWYTRGEYSTAVHCYRRALDFLDDEHQNFQEPASELQKLLDTRLIVYNNLAAAQLKMDAYEAALKSVDFVLTIQPNNVKALFRKGKILATKGQIDDAIDILRKALKLEPETKIIHQELSKLTSRKKKEETETRAMYKRMFETKTEMQKPSDKKNKLFSWSVIAGGVLTVACAIVLYKQMNSSG